MEEIKQVRKNAELQLNNEGSHEVCRENRFLWSSALPRDGMGSTDWKPRRGCMEEEVWNQPVGRKWPARLAGATVAEALALGPPFPQHDPQPQEEELC